MAGGGGGGGVTVVGRAEIDTRAPFRSVKEAVVLFGEKVLAGELHAGAGRRLLATHDQLQQNRAATTPPARWPTVNQVKQVAGAVAAATRHAPAMAELEEAKQELEKERLEKQKMVGCILSLQEELGNAMRELKKLKERDNDDDDGGGEAAAKVIDLQVEDLKFVEIDDNKPQPPLTVTAAGSASPGEFQKRRYVTFADPPTVASAAYRAPPLPDVVLMEPHHHRPAPPQYHEVRFQRQMSAGHEAVKAVAAAAEQEARKKKKKPLIPLVGALFMRKKKSSSSSSSSSSRSCHDDSALNSRSGF